MADQADNGSLCPLPVPKSKGSRKEGMETSSEKNVSDSFPPSTKLEARRLTGDRCWLCGDTPPDAAHVLAKSDPARFVVTAIRISTALRIQVGFLYPTDLKFFIEFECEDRERRRRERAEGRVPIKKIPDAATYLSRQVTEGLVPVGSIGELYTPIFLKQFYVDLPPDLQKPVYEYPSRERPWHGAPIAALRKAIAALGSLRAEVSSDDTFQDLQLLHDLYFRRRDDFNIVSGVPQAPSIRDQRPNLPPGGGPGDSHHGDEPPDSGHPSGAGTKRKSAVSQMSGKQTKSGKVAKRTENTSVALQNSQNTELYVLPPGCNDNGRTGGNQEQVKRLKELGRLAPATVMKG
ncbi:hypothetical protein VTN00DRAFT_977 [Thermoascus crustaceus]|uniref:uncharacterized protein n=1 Tax=Thermoascus crustaceus TaxID=5088 RepID=UPI0037433134